MEARLHLRLQVQVHDRLRDPVGDRGHAEHPRPTTALWYLDRLHRRRHVAPRAEPIPELVEVPRQVRLERLDRLLVDTGSSLVGLHPQPRLPDQPLGNSKRLAVRLRPACRATGRPRARDDRFPPSTPKPRPSSRHLHAGHHLARQQAPARLIPDPHAAPGFDVTHIVSTRHQWIAHARLLGPHLTRSKRAFSATLSTPALDRRTSRWFAASPCRATAEAHQPTSADPSISDAAPHHQSGLLHPDLLMRSWHTRAHLLWTSRAL